MIIRVRAHASVANMLVVDAGPELSSFMGSFAPARWQRDARCYWLEAEHLEAFRRHVTRNEHTLVDTRAGTSSDGEKFSGPLPECRACGQPASRKVALELKFCPACGEAWDPMVFQGPGELASLRTTCTRCGHHQAGRSPWCGQCGGAMPDPDAASAEDHVAATRAAIAREGRVQLEEPVLFGEAVAGLNLQPPVDAS